MQINCREQKQTAAPKMNYNNVKERKVFEWFLFFTTVTRATKQSRSKQRLHTITNHINQSRMIRCSHKWHQDAKIKPELFLLKHHLPQLKPENEQPKTFNVKLNHKVINRLESKNMKQLTENRPIKNQRKKQLKMVIPNEVMQQNKNQTQCIIKQ